MNKFYALFDMLDALMGGSLLPTPYATKESLDADEAYIYNLKVQSISTGVTPFDANDNPGNDSGADNRIVRSFDTVTYMLLATTASYNSDSYKAGKMKFEFVLPYTKDQAEFDISAMTWMMTTGAYAPATTTETRNIGGVDTTCQVLTCWRDLPQNADTGIALPGENSVSVIVKVKGMVNGAIVQPIFSAAMEYNTWEGTCETHSTVEKKTVTGDPVTVSAAPKYNVRVVAGDFTGKKGAFDFSTGNELAANKGNTTVTGRLVPYGVVVQLYNDNASKGLKGIELPQGEITFKLNVSSTYKKDAGGTVDAATTAADGYLPLLWSYGNNYYSGSWTCDDGRSVAGSYADGVYQLPNSSASDLDAYNACYHGGNYSATQTGAEISVALKNYKIDVDKMPTHVGSTAMGVQFTANIGCFSAGEFWMLQPFNQPNNTSSDYDVVQDYGAGTFTTTVKATDLKATSIGNNTQMDAAGTNNAQMVKTDDAASATAYLAMRGSFTHAMWYTDWENTGGSYRGVDKSHATFNNGKDATLVGSNIAIATGCQLINNGEEDNRTRYATCLLKFDAAAIELTGEVFDALSRAICANSGRSAARHDCPPQGV